MPPVPEPGLLTVGLHLEFQAEPVAVRRSLKRMLGQPPLVGLSPEDRGVAELVLAEVLNNIVEHAYGGGFGRVSVTLNPDPAGIRCLVVDEGHAFPRDRLPEGRLPGGADVPLEDLPEGGFGWHLIRSLCSGLTYERTIGKNQLGFVLPASGRADKRP